eukprot:TRINITY_DN215_c0_g1_i1.p1 TRINITY_DN215_c0_g1~~TRINITY_DN215_c0_g1_i1.p1  ORF type:complete len:173 (+),score=47.96 TRINITY_DN215_c0_g1_i1:55-573(+)
MSQVELVAYLQNQIQKLKKEVSAMSTQVLKLTSQLNEMEATEIKQKDENDMNSFEYSCEYSPEASIDSHPSMNESVVYATSPSVEILINSPSGEKFKTNPEFTGYNVFIKPKISQNNEIKHAKPFYKRFNNIDNNFDNNFQKNLNGEKFNSRYEHSRSLLDQMSPPKVDLFE